MTADALFALAETASDSRWSRVRFYNTNTDADATTRDYAFDLGEGYRLWVRWSNFRLDATNTIDAKISGGTGDGKLDEVPLLAQDNEEERVLKSLALFSPEEGERIRKTILTLYHALKARLG